MSKPLNLNGAVAVLTGAGSGIGRATALACARRGASVVVSDLSEQRVDEVVEQIGALGGRSSGCRSMSLLKRNWRSSVTLRSSGSVGSTW